MCVWGGAGAGRKEPWGERVVCFVRYTTNFFFTLKKSWNLCYSGPSNHPYNSADNPAVGAPEFCREVLCPGLRPHGHQPGREKWMRGPGALA